MVHPQGIACASTPPESSPHPHAASEFMHPLMNKGAGWVGRQANRRDCPSPSSLYFQTAQQAFFLLCTTSV